jgi:hypothetical protein
MVARNQAPPSPRFSLGQMVATPGALAALTKAGQNPSAFIARHVAGDWGDLCDDDRQLNDQAVIDSDRILSAYTLQSGVKIWVITESDRSVTTLLLPDEY